MKPQLTFPPLFAIVIAVAGTAAVHAASFERAPELPDLSFRSLSESGVAVAASVAGRSVKAASCPALKLSGAKLSRAGVFSNDWDVEFGGSKAGKIEFVDDGVALKDALGNTAAKLKKDGSATDCSGESIGSVELKEGSGSSQLIIKNAKGEIVAFTGWIDDIGFELKSVSGGNAAKIDKDHWYSDTVTLAIAPDADSRLVAIASVLNTGAVYKRSNERRRERMGDGPRGGRDR